MFQPFSSVLGRRLCYPEIFHENNHRKHFIKYCKDEDVNERTIQIFKLAKDPNRIFPKKKKVCIWPTST